MNSNSNNISKGLGARIFVLLMSLLIVFAGIASDAFGDIAKTYAEDGNATSRNDFDPVKEINGQKEPFFLAHLHDVFTYTVSQKIPAGTTVVSFEDTLEDVLEAKEASVNVEGVEAAIDGQKVSASINDTTVLEGLAGKNVTLTIKAKIKDDVTYYDLNEYPDREIPNTATVKINDISKRTNTVEVASPEDPEKKINGHSGSDHLSSMHEEFTYTVSQKISHGATELSFEDTLEDVLEATEASIDVEGVEAVIDGQKVSASIKDKDVLEGLAGEKVTLTIKAKIRDDVTYVDLINKYGDTSVPNQATVTLNNNAKVTNEVIATPPEEPLEKPEKKINGQKDKVTLDRRHETFVYTIEQKIPAKAENIVFEDALEDVLEVVGTPTINVEGVEPEIEGQKITAGINDEDVLKGLAGKTVTLTIKARIKESVTDDDLINKYGDTSVPNKAKVTINDSVQETDKVFVKPPEPVREDPEKFINGQKDLVELSDRKAPFTYTITQKIPAGAVNVVFEDTLEDVLDATDAEIDVAGVDAVIDGQKVTAAIEDARALGNTTVTLTISARIKDSASDPDLEKYTDRRIPNVANVSIDGNGKVTNEVLVTPPTVVTEEPIKKVNGQDKVNLSGRNEVFTYTISQMVPPGYATLKFEDTLEDVLEVVGTPEINAEGAVIRVNGQTVTAEINDTKACEGKIAVMTVKARIKADVTDEELDIYTNREIPNVATVVLDNYVNVTNAVKVAPPSDEQKIDEQKIDEQKKPVPKDSVEKGVYRIDTGDEQDIITYIMFALAAAVAMSVMITLRKKKR